MAKDNQWIVDLLEGNNKGLISGSNDSVANYHKLVNQRGLFDDVGDAFTEQSKQPAVNGKQKMTNALMAGVGAGLKGSQNQLRAAKLQELEKFTKEAALSTAQMQAQIGMAARQKATFYNYANNNYGDFKKLNDAFGAGDQQTANSLGILLYNRFKAENPDLGEKMPPIDHIYNGKAYLDAEGKTEGIFMKDLLAPLISTLPAELQREVPNLTTLTMQNKFKQSDLLESGQVDKLQSEVALNKAHAGAYNAQADADRTPKVNQHVTEKTFDTNVKWMDEQDKIVDNAILKNKVFDKLEAILKRESAAGGTPWDAFKRYYKGKTGDDKDLTEAKLLQKYFFTDIKGVAGNPNTKEWEDLVGRIISTGQNVDGALSVLNFEREMNNESIQHYQHTVDELQANDYGLLYNDPRVKAKVKEKIGSQATQNNTTNRQNTPSSVRFKPDE